MKISPYLQKNVEALVKAGNPTPSWFAKEVPDPAAVVDRIVVNRFGLMDWAWAEGKTLFDAMPPDAYYNKWLQQDRAGISMSVVVGSNLGYGVNRILSTTPNTHKVMVIEPNPAILVAALGQTDYAPFIEMGKLILLPPDREVVTRYLRQADVQFLFGRITLRVDIPSQQMGPEYSQWGSFCQGALENLSVELATLRKQQDTMVGNELGNFRRAMQDGSLNALRDAAQGSPAVILGAGPSIERFGPELAGRHGGAIMGTALQTLPALKRLGLKPHFCMAIDYSPGMRRVFERLDLEWAKDIPLIYSTKLNPYIVENYPGPTLPLWTMGGLGTFIFKDEELVLDAGGNVSVTLFRFLSWCGVSSILLAGQDFAWKASRSHADGHHTATKTWDPSDKRVVTLTNREGETIHSSLSYLTSLRDMETDIANASIPVYNLYSGGADIRGAQVVDMDGVEREGLLSGKPGGAGRFLDAMESAHQPRVHPRFEPRSVEWSQSLKAVSRRLEKLFRKPDKHHAEIVETLGQLHIFLRQDPLYLPYLYNESMDVSGLLHAARRYGPEDMASIRTTLKKVMEKIRFMDRALSPEAEIVPADAPVGPKAAARRSRNSKRRQRRRHAAA